MTTVRILDDDDKNNILKDGETRTFKMFMKDGITPNPNLSPAQRVAAAVSATRQAMASFDSAMHDGYRHKPGFVRRAATMTADSVTADATRDAAYEEYDRRQNDAWQSKSPPSGSYPVGTSQEGDACTINGAAGTLQAIDGHNGWLECVADDDNDNSSSSNPYDSAGKFDSVKAQAIKDAAYAAYDSEISQRWRNK